MMFKRKKLGIVLITSMFFVVITIMLSVLLFQASYSTLRLSSSYSESEQAYYAAMSGLEYARFRFNQKETDAGGFQWMQKISGAESLFDDIEIVENGGVVTGYIGGNKKNSSSKFVIAFVSPTDPFKMAVTDDPVKTLSQSSSEASTLNFLSCNNFNNSGEGMTIIKEAGNFKQDLKVPAMSALITVKGISGRSVKYARALIKMASPGNMGAFSTMSRKNINVMLAGSNPQFLVSSNAGEGTANLKTPADIDAVSSAGNNNLLVMENGGTAYAQQVYLNQKHKRNIYNPFIWDLDSSAVPVTDPEKYGIKIDSKEDISKLFASDSGAAKLTWDKVNESFNASGSIEKGAYIYIKDTGWKYYALEALKHDKSDPQKVTAVISESTKQHNLQNKSLAFLSPTAENRNPIVKIQENISSDGSVFIASLDKLPKIDKKGKMTVLPDSLSDELRTQVSLVNSSAVQINEDTDNSKDFDAAGLVIQGTVTGNGNIYSKNNVFIQGGSYLEAEKNNGVAVYAQKDMNVMPSTGVKYDKSFISSCNEVWKNFYDDTKKDTVVYRDGELSRAAEDLLNFRDKSGKTLSAILTDNLCTDPVDQLRFAESFITKNSAWLSDDIKVSQPEQILYTIQADFPSKKGADSLDPYYKVPDTPKKQHAVQQFSGIKMEISMSQKKGGFNYLGENDGKYVMNKVENTMYYEIWIHSWKDKTGEDDPSNRPHDLYVLIPLNNEGDPEAIYTRFGWDKREDPSLSYLPVNDDAYRYYRAEIGKNYLNKNVSEDGNASITAKAGDNEIVYAARVKTKNTAGSEENSLAVNLKDLIGNLLSQSQDDSAIQEMTKRSGSPAYGEPVNGFSTDYRQEARDTLKEMYDAVESHSLIRKSSSAGFDFALPYNNSVASGSNFEITELYSYSGSLTNDGIAEKHLVLNKKPDMTFSLPTAADTILKGMIYCRNGNFNSNTGSGTLSVVGGVITYNGGINLNAASVNLCYEPGYMTFVDPDQNGAKTNYIYLNIFSQGILD